MGKTIVISQPMFLPWPGLFEQVALADIFLHYDDVQFPMGRNFMSRVQLKGPEGTTWLTAPLNRKQSGPLIRETWLNPEPKWRSKHLKTIHHLYSKAPHYEAVAQFVEALYEEGPDNLCNFNCLAIERISDWLGLETKFRFSSKHALKTNSTQRLLDLCQLEGANDYITGHGALNYLDHDLFEQAGVRVRYMQYQKKPYRQLHEPFDPHVSILDLMANMGPEARDYLCSQAVDRSNLNAKTP